MKKLTEMSLQELLNPEGFACDCGKTHCALPLKYLAVEKGALNKLPEALAALEAKKQGREIRPEKYDLGEDPDVILADIRKNPVFRPEAPAAKGAVVIEH